MKSTWKLAHGSDRRIRAQHPWVFSNELSQSPKGHEPGAPVKLFDAKGEFVAAGYGNPHSLIAFRALSFDPNIQDWTSEEFLASKIISAWKARFQIGYKSSFRLVYGETDFLPGLVIDRYLAQKGTDLVQIFCCQQLTAGIQSAASDMLGLLEKVVLLSNQMGLSEVSWENTGIVLRNDVQIRKLEGLSVEESKLVKSIEGFNLGQADIIIDSALGTQPVIMSCDLLQGQKTGFFLDQAYNIKLLCQNLVKTQWKEKKIKILDLCTYVGQWSVQIASTLKQQGLEAQITAVDISSTALEFAHRNISRQGVEVDCKKMDVADSLDEIADRSYDVVIADPPAFIKARKDIPTGKHAYLKLNTSAFRIVKTNGLVVSCSCSGLLEETDLIDVLAKAIRRNKRIASGIARGGHSADHPTLMSFPEGFYLKMFLHHVRG